MNRTKIMIFLLNIIAIGLILAVVMVSKTPQKTAKICPVLNKTEANGKYYLEVALEVSGEEYIGYDVGDDYALEVE